MKSTRFTLAQPAELTDAIDAARGDVPRARWINEACARRLKRRIRLRGRGRPKATEKSA